MSGGFSRRGLLTGAVATVAGAALGGPTRAQGVRRSLRVAYVTDVHLEANEASTHALASCLRKVHSLNERPDLIIQGGDIIMDGLMRDAASVERQYAAAKDVLRRTCDIPVEHVIGNHDVWGWGTMGAPGVMTDPRFGKNWWLSWSELPNTYRSFNIAGWHFVILDSIMPDRFSLYAARLDLAQRRWLEQDLADTDPSMPVCIVSHAPILSTAAMFFGPAEHTGHWHVTRNLMHIDARHLKDLFYRHRNVKICLSGHIHMADRVDYNGVKHFGIGAVCGAWWKGPMQETPPQFAVVDFFEDGNSHVTYIPC
ncbi:MAG TPA: metallophosphoesterase [Fimbriimonadaceae bacterium]|nr:metallophosphoesterase [Fimbriimonadaceae bacterium]